MRAMLTPVEARQSAGGLDLKGLSDTELDSYIKEAMSLIDAHTHNKWRYTTTVDEQHVWNGQSLKVWTYNGPVRVITSYKIVTATFGGKDWAFDLNANPVLDTGDPSILPSSFGDINVDRAVDMFNASPLIITGALLPLVSQYGAILKVSYTSGYDDGTVQADGFTVPYPDFLKNVCRMLVRHRLERWFRNFRVGMAGMLEVRSGNTMYRMPQSRGAGSSDPTIPDDARELLDDMWLPWVR